MKKKLKKTAKKQHWDPKFSSEHLLQRALAGLLARMPKNSRVQILQGPQEFGKDIVFWNEGPLGEPIACACVIKNKQISGNVERSSGARTVMLQIEQALDTPFIDSTGAEIRVSRVYVMSPAPVSQNTLLSIRGKLATRGGQIDFRCGADLFELFREYWPDFYADEAAFIEQHFSSMIGRMSSASPISAVAEEANLGTVNEAERRIYVRPSFHRTVTRYQLTEVTKLVLGEQDIAQMWTEREFGIIERRHKSLIAFINTAALWGLTATMDEEDDLKGFTNSLTMLRKQLRKAWETTFLKKLNQPYFEKGDITPMSMSYLAEADDKEARKKLASAVEERVRIVSEILAPMLTATSKGHISEASGVKETAMVLDERFMLRARLSDCLHWAPNSFVEAKETATYRLGKTLLDDFGRSVMVVGGPGSGKTTFCRWNALKDAEDFNKGATSRVPIYVALHRIPTDSPASFIDTFLWSFGHSGLVDGGSLQIRKDLPIRLYLDGLDEVPNIKWRQSLVTLAKVGLDEFSNLQIVLTARDYIFASWLSWLPRVQISGLGQEEIQRLVAQWFSGDDVTINKFSAALDESESITDIMSTPLLATLVILVYRRKHRLPKNKAQLYQMFVDLLSQGWDLAKQVLRVTKFSADIKVMVLSVLARDIHQKGVRGFNQKAIQAAVRKTLPRMLSDSRTLAVELIADGLLIKEGQELRFRHHSFQEFFAARELMHTFRISEVRNLFWSYLAGNDWWREVVRFYIELAEKPRELATLLFDDDKLKEFYGTPQHCSVLKMIQEAYPAANIGSDAQPSSA